MKIFLINKQKNILPDTGSIKKITEYAAGKFDRSKNIQVNIIFTSAKEIRVLNLKYRNIDEPTDVLSFSYMDFNTPVIVSVNEKNKKVEKGKSNCGTSEYGPVEIGEIIISPEMAVKNIENKATGSGCRNKKEAEKANDAVLLKEIAMLIIHGFLHLYGYDHENNRQRKVMENIQETLLQDIIRLFFNNPLV